MDKIDHESDDGLETEIEQLNSISSFDSLNAGITATFTIPLIPSDNIQASPLLATPEKFSVFSQTEKGLKNSNSQELRTPQSGKLDSLLEAISERRLKARFDALANSPWSACLSDEDEEGKSFSIAAAALLVASKTISSDADGRSNDFPSVHGKEDRDFFSAFPSTAVEGRPADGLRTPSSPGGKTLQDVMSSSSPDITPVTIG